MNRIALLLPTLGLLGLQPIRSDSANSAAPAPAPIAQPLKALPYTPGLDVKAMDLSANACTDFYQYSCGGWIKSNPMPADQASWSVYAKLADDNERFLWGILGGLGGASAERSATQQQIGDYFAACMDEGAVDRLGSQPVRANLDRIERLASRQELPAVLGLLRLAGSDDEMFFQFTSDQNLADSTQVIAFAEAGGLGLPDRDFYTKRDARAKDIRRKYLAHVMRMFELLGDSPAAATRESERVMRIELALAEASLTRVQKRDPHNLFHPTDLQALRALTPSFDWEPYLRAIGLSDIAALNVTEPKFFQAFDRQVRTESLASLKTYLRWHTVHAAAPYLSATFVDENFRFYGKTLRGVPQLQPRWKRCVKLVDAQLGEALGQEFVRKAFGPELKRNTLRMTMQIEQAMQNELNDLGWMSPATKQQALAKLHAMTNKIGYPNKWRDYSSVVVKRGDFFGNVERLDRFETRRQLAKIGKPVDRDEWGMTPPTVNAYYNPQMNDINFPAGVLQPPLYDPKMDDAPNYGNTGGTIGHELTHAFDDEGRQFDAQGNLRDWWTEKDARAFAERAQCVVDQYAQYTIIDDIKINSRLTEGEDIADLGGLVLAWMAWRTESEHHPPGPRERFTPEQRFFIGYAQWACEDTRAGELRVRALTEPHSPGRYRVNGLMVNTPEFAKAFSCKVGQPMVSPKPCKVW
jgi:putative endopeptidase